MQIEKDYFIKKDGKWVRNENREKSHSCMLPFKSKLNDKNENNQEENNYPPEQLSEKEIGEIRKGIYNHPALKLFSDDTRKKILFGDIKPPTEYDKYINENPQANEVEISQIAWLARETAYVGRHLERLVEEKIDNEIAEWYKNTGLAFTYRIKPIELSCEKVEAVLILRLPNLREEFKTSYEKFLSIANKCDIDRTKWFNSLPVKPIEDFKKAAENFHHVVYVIHAEALVQLEKNKKQEKTGQGNDGNVYSPNGKTSESWLWKLYEKTIKAAFDAILDKLNPS